MNYFVLILAVLVLIRFINLTGVPPFGDETLYLWLADQFIKDPSNAFKSLSYGVFPIIIWLHAIFLLLLNHLLPPLIYSRAIPTLIDIIGSIFVFKIGSIIFNTRYGLVATIIYLSLPLNFFHGRLVMLESLTNTTSLAAIYWIIKALSKNALTDTKNVLIIVSLLLTSFFTKPISIIYLGAITTAPFLFTKIKSFDFKNYFNMQSKIILILALFSLIAFSLYFPISNEFSNRYITDTSSFYQSLMRIKLNLFKYNFWAEIYLTGSIIFICLVSTIVGLKKDFEKITWLLIWIISVVLLSAVFSRNFFPRHLYPIVAPISLLCAYFFFYLSKSKYILPLFILILLPSWILIGQLLISPGRAYIAPEDKQQFYEDWTSGVGHDKIAGYIKTISQSEDIIIFTEDDASLYWAIPFLYDIQDAKFIPSKNLSYGKLPEELDKYRDKNIYILINRNQVIPKDWPTQLAFSYPKGPYRSINLYKYRND